jgi:protein translocase SecG subunit
VDIVKQILFVIALIVAVVFALLVFITGKGDAMSGGSSVRTSFKGKASFEDFISKLTFILGIAFMALMITIDILDHRVGGGASSSAQMDRPLERDTTPGAPNTPKK